MASILVVEDVPAVLMSLKIILEGEGHKVTAAENGLRGIEMINKTDFDLVITDIWMPGASGTDLIRESRRRSPQTPILAITGGSPNQKAAVQNAPDAQEFGADHVLQKPFEKKDLLAIVSKLARPHARAE
jgi:CheY-like chemotaxis protein